MQLSNEQKKKLYEEGIDVFNKEDFYECHEVLEKVWLQDQGPDRLFYQGIIQVAACFHHISRKKLYEASKVLQLGLEKLKDYPDIYLRLELGTLKNQLKWWEDYLSKVARQEKTDSPPPYPKLRLIK